MNQGTYPLAASMINQFNRLDQISNNLANINTNGFKQEGTTETTFNYYLQRAYEENIVPTKINTVTNNIPKIDAKFINSEMGPIAMTGNALDFALNDPDTFFKVQNANGDIVYTRDGSFKNLDNFLVDGNGNHVLNSDNEPIVVEDNFASQIGVTKIAYTNLEKIGDNTYKLKNPNELEIFENNDNLIVSYTPKRAKKDEYNRTKGLKRLEKKVKSGKLTKDQINSRGYNKYLHLKNEINVEIDYEKFYQDSYWDGLKGYITNTNLSNDAVISNYSNLWQIEKAFRMSKSDLEIRPIYHFTRRRIEAHISISFVAYSIYKELERLLYLYNAPFSVKKAREIIHNIYQIEVTLPDSGVKQKVLLQMDEEQQFLVNMIQNEISKSFG